MEVTSDDSQKMLSLEEAKMYMTDVFDIPNVNELLSNPNKLEVVRTINDAYREVEPYQNISTLAEPLNKRHRPTWEEITSNIKRKHGGRCYSHHIFLYEFYRALNFEVSLVRVQVLCSRFNHLVLLFRNLNKPGDLYLVDEGSAYPTFNPISLDFEDESPVINDSFLEYKYTKRDGSFYRMHRKGDKGDTRFPAENEFYEGRFYEFTLKDETNDVDSFNEMYDAVYTDPSLTPFHNSFRIIYFPGKKAKIIANRKLLLEVNEGELDATRYETEEDLIECTMSIVPMFERDLIRKALSHLTLFK